MKTKTTFDAVQMVREIRDAYYLKQTKKNFDPKTFEEIKKKWEKKLKVKTAHNMV